MPDRRRGRYTTYLVALTGQAGGPQGPVVYAAMTRSAAEALEAVRALADPPGSVAVVGSLSTRTAKAIGLKREEVRAM